MNTIEQLVEALIARLRMMQSALGVDGTCGEAAAALERMGAELETANRIKTEQIDYAIGLQRAIEAHCREELAPEDVCPHHAEKLNKHFNRQQVFEKKHTKFYSEVVTLRSTVEHLRLRENRLTAERDSLKEDYTRIKESAALWHDRYKTKCQESVDRQAILGAEIVALEAAIGEKK